MRVWGREPTRSAGTVNAFNSESSFPPARPPQLLRVLTNYKNEAYCFTKVTVTCLALKYKLENLCPMDLVVKVPNKSGAIQLQCRGRCLNASHMVIST